MAQAETASEMRRRGHQNSVNVSGGPFLGNTINEIDLMVSQNTANLENLKENENIKIHDDEIEEEAPPKLQFLLGTRKLEDPIVMVMLASCLRRLSPYLMRSFNQQTQ